MAESTTPSPSPTAVVWGLGELGSAFAHGLLRSGCAVHPVRRDDDPARVARAVPSPEIVVLAVSESDLDPALAEVPAGWRGRVALVQNGLVPSRWEGRVEDPTVAVVWFEKKRDRALRVLQDTRVAGPAAPLLVRALVEIGIGAHPIRRSELTRELAVKNVWVDTLNIGGLLLQQVGHREVTAGDLLGEGHERVAKLARELLRVHERSLSVELDRERVLRQIFDVFEAHPDQKAIGRSAQQRMADAVAKARSLGVEAPTLAGLLETREVVLP